MIPPRPLSRLVRAAGPLALAAAMTFGVAACSGSGGDDPTVVEADPEKAQQAVDAGLEAHAKGDLTAAAEEYEKALEYDPENKYALYNLALIDEASGNYGLAEEKYRQALESAPTYVPALYNLAILVTDNDPDEAISLYRKAVATKPKDAAAWLNLGLLLRAAGKDAEGDAAVDKAISLNPELEDPAAS